MYVVTVVLSNTFVYTGSGKRLENIIVIATLSRHQTTEAQSTRRGSATLPKLGEKVKKVNADCKKGAIALVS
jgi:hypothetical protein